MRLLVTRPEPDNERTAAALRDRGHEVLLAPLLRIDSIDDADLGAPPWAGVLLTSANGARAVGAHSRRSEFLALPALAVGRSSAEAARAVGFSDVISADGDAAGLARIAAARFAGARSPLLYAAGEDRSADIAGELAKKGLIVRTVVAYRAVKMQQLPGAVWTALGQGGIDGVLHFSRRSAESYLDCGRDILRQALTPLHYCLSMGVAEPLRRAGATRIEVAQRPDEASLLALVASSVMPTPQSNRLE
ncbi:MAG TPA: uroporphyrinogen-III synthase [Thermomicrobiales bacterium]|nr:uroporphyrinogen-III synthase [Thermomicrobiales bacterium]